MVAKKTASKTDILWDYNDKFHDYMGQLMQAKVEEEVVYVPAKLIHSIIEDINAAKKEIEQTPELKKVKSELDICKGSSIYDCFIGLSKIADSLGKLSAEADFVVISKSAWQALQVPFLNDMANLVHIGGGALIGETGKLKGCSAVGKFALDDGKAISKYCSGVTTGSVEVTTVPLKKVTIADGKTLIQKYPTFAKHVLGCHSVEPSFQTSDEEINMAIEYHDSDGGYEPGSTYRLKGVNERLQKQGFTCGVKNPEGIKSGKDLLFCNKNNVSPDEIRTLATYFSYLWNADTSHQGTAITPLVRDAAWDFAVSENQKYGDNTWQSAKHGQLDWGELKIKMIEDEKFAKNIIYNDLRELLILRDIHHMIEEKYNIDHGGSALAGMKAILENGKKMNAIINKNGWSSISSYIAQLQALVNEGKPHNISGTSDAIGHVAHSIIYSKLGSAGKYGGCSMGGNISNINTGNLAYCEGILEGESGTAISNSAGNSFTHKILPATINVAVDEDDFADFEYSFKVNLPTDEALKVDVKTYLKAQGFICSDNLCKIATKDLNLIRQTALFLSNLKGVDSKIGIDCTKKAVEAAGGASVEQNKKGIFAFTQSPIHVSANEWIDICFKQYEIPPPNMTKEELELLKKLGPKKIYGGCDFSESEIIPNVGFLKYCEGVRKNPQANINAYFTPSGQLVHFYHGEHASHDKVADVVITPVGDSKYDLALSNIDMRDKSDNKPVQKQVIKRLQSIGLTCGAASCNTADKPLPEVTIRHIASYLSSMHHVGSLDTSCVQKAEEYAWTKALSLPNDVTAHDSMTYPHLKEDWAKSVCGGVKPVTEATAQVPQPAAETGIKKFVSWKTPIEIVNSVKGKAKWTMVGGCNSLTAKTPTKAIAAFCAGVADKYIDNTGASSTGIAAALTASVNTMQILHTGNIVFTSSGKNLILTLPDKLMHPGITSYLVSLGFWQFPSDSHTFKSNVNNKPKFEAGKFFSYLHGFGNLDDECKPKAIANAIEKAGIGTYGEAVSPYTTEQWKKFCTGLPTTPDHVALVDLLDNIKTMIKASIAGWKEEGQSLNAVYVSFSKTWPQYKLTPSDMVTIQGWYDLAKKTVTTDEENKKKIIKLNVKYYQKAFPGAQGPGVYPSFQDIAKWTAQETGFTVGYEDIKDIADELVAEGLFHKTPTGYIWAKAPEAVEALSVVDAIKKYKKLNPKDVIVYFPDIIEWVQEEYGVTLANSSIQAAGIELAKQGIWTGEYPGYNWAEPAKPEPQASLHPLPATEDIDTIFEPWNHYNSYAKVPVELGKIMSLKMGNGGGAKWVPHYKSDEAYKDLNQDKPFTYDQVKGLWKQCLAEYYGPIAVLDYFGGGVPEINQAAVYKETKDFIAGIFDSNMELSYDTMGIYNILKGSGKETALGIVAEILSELITEGKIYNKSGDGVVLASTLSPGYKKKPAQKPTANIDAELKKASDEYMTLYKKLFDDPKMVIKCQEAAQYKKLTKICQDYIHAWMKQELLNNFHFNISFEQTLEKAFSALTKNFPNLTKLQVKLQLEIEKNDLLCKGVLPTSPGETQQQACDIVAEDEQKNFEDLDDYTKEAVINKITFMAKAGLSVNEITEVVSSPGYNFNLSDALMTEINKAVGKHWQDKKPETPLTTAAGIIQIMMNDPDAWFTPSEIALAWAVNKDMGSPPPPNVIKKEVGNLTQEGKLLWQITAGTYKLNPDKIKTETEEPKFGDAGIWGYVWNDLEKIYKTNPGKKADIKKQIMTKYPWVAEPEYKEKFQHDFEVAWDMMQKTTFTEAIKQNILEFLGEVNANASEAEIAQGIGQKLDYTHTLLNELQKEDKIIYHHPVGKIEGYWTLKNEPEKTSFSEVELETVIKINDFIEKAYALGWDTQSIIEKVEAQFNLKHDANLAHHVQFEVEGLKGAPDKPKKHETTGNWYFVINSSEYGDDEFGPYDTKAEAEKAMGWLKKSQAQQSPDISYTYTGPYKKEAPEHLTVENLKNKVLDIINGAPSNVFWDEDDIVEHLSGDYDIFDPDTDVLGEVLEELDDEGKIVHNDENETWHSKMMLKVVNGENTLVPMFDPDDFEMWVLAFLKDNAGAPFDAMQLYEQYLGKAYTGEDYPEVFQPLLNKLQGMAAEGKIFSKQGKPIKYGYKAPEEEKAEFDPDKFEKWVPKYLASEPDNSFSALDLYVIYTKDDSYDVHKPVPGFQTLVKMGEEGKINAKQLGQGVIYFSYKKTVPCLTPGMVLYAIDVGKKNFNEIKEKLKAVDCKFTDDELKKVLAELGISGKVKYSATHETWTATQDVEEEEGEEEEEEEDTEQWFFKVSSDEYGTDIHGPYETEEEAKETIDTIKQQILGLKDGIERQITLPFMAIDETAAENYDADYVISVMSLKDKEEEPPTPATMVTDEAIASFIKGGMSAEGVAVLFGGDKNTLKTATKLYKVYHPDETVMTMPVYKMPSWAQAQVKAKAQSMLNAGKTQEDATWWLSYHMHLTKDSVEHMVKALAKIPLSQTEELLKAFKVLGIGEELGGCKVADGGLGDLKGQTVSYCQGVIAPMGDALTAGTYDDGKKVIHQTPNQVMILNTDTSDKTWTSKLEYSTDDPSAKDEIEHISRVLSDWGFTCENKSQNAPYLVCQYRGSDGQTMSIEDQDAMRRAAVFLSSIDTIPQLPKTCIAPAFEYAKNHAIGISKTSKPWTVSVFPSTVEEWEKIVCQKVK